MWQNAFAARVGWLAFRERRELKVRQDELAMLAKKSLMAARSHVSARCTAHCYQLLHCTFIGQLRGCNWLNIMTLELALLFLALPTVPLWGILLCRAGSDNSRVFVERKEQWTWSCEHSWGLGR